MKKYLIFLISLNLFGNELKIKENKYFIKPKEKLILSASGGKPKYSWSSKKGDIIYFDKNHSNITYQAPKTYGVDIVSVYDLSGKVTSKEFRVIMPLAITPKVRYVKNKNSVKFTIIGGSGKYNIKIGSGKFKLEKNNLIYFNDGNSTQIEIIDKITKENIKAFVKVIDKLEIEIGEKK